MKSLFAALLLPTLAIWSAPRAEAQTVTFDLESIPVYSPLPQSQTVNGITATFTGNFSIQSADTTFCRQIALTGHYLWPSSLDRNVLTVTFDHPIASVSFPFASVDYQDNAEVPANVLLTAFSGATSIGTATAHGTYNGAFYPEGHILFTAPAGQTFDSFTLYVPWCSTGTTNLLADNFKVTGASGGGTAKVKLTLPPVSGYIGKNATLKATLKDAVTLAGLSGESLQFSVDGVNVGGPVLTDSLGKAKATVPILEGTPLGAHTIQVAFAGDVAYAAKTTTGTLNVYPGPVKITVFNKTQTAGSAVYLAAKLTNWSKVVLPNQTMSFSVQGVSVGSAITNAKGVATFRYVIPAGTLTGTYTITADFGGDADHQSGTGLGTLTVN